MSDENGLNTALLLKGIDDKVDRLIDEVRTSAKGVNASSIQGLRQTPNEENVDHQKRVSSIATGQGVRPVAPIPILENSGFLQGNQHPASTVKKKTKKIGKRVAVPHTKTDTSSPASSSYLTPPQYSPSKMDAGVVPISMAPSPAKTVKATQGKTPVLSNSTPPRAITDIVNAKRIDDNYMARQKPHKKYIQESRQGKTEPVNAISEAITPATVKKSNIQPAGEGAWHQKNKNSAPAKPRPSVAQGTPLYSQSKNIGIREESKTNAANKGFLKTLTASISSMGTRVSDKIADVTGGESNGSDIAGLAAGGPLWGAIREVVDFVTEAKSGNTLTSRVGMGLIKKFVDRKKGDPSDGQAVTAPSKASVSIKSRSNHPRARDAQGHFIKEAFGPHTTPGVKSETKTNRSGPGRKLPVLDATTAAPVASPAQEQNGKEQKKAPAIRPSQAGNAVTGNIFKAKPFHIDASQDSTISMDANSPRTQNRKGFGKKSKFETSVHEGKQTCRAATVDRNPDKNIAPHPMNTVSEDAPSSSISPVTRHSRHKQAGMTVSALPQKPVNGQTTIPTALSVHDGVSLSGDSNSADLDRKYRVPAKSIGGLVKYLPKKPNHSLVSTMQSGDKTSPVGKNTQPPSGTLKHVSNEPVLRQRNATREKVTNQVSATRHSAKDNKRIVWLESQNIGSESHSSPMATTSRAISSSVNNSARINEQSQVAKPGKVSVPSANKRQTKSKKSSKSQEPWYVKDQNTMIEKETEISTGIKEAIDDLNKNSDDRNRDLIKAVSSISSGGGLLGAMAGGGAGGGVFGYLKNKFGMGGIKNSVGGVVKKGGRLIDPIKKILTFGSGAGTGGLGLSGLLSSGSGTALTGGLGAGAAASSVGLVGASGAAGYGLGTLINKGIGKLTGGGEGWLGNWLFDKIHGNDDKKRKDAEAKKYREKFKDRMTPSAFEAVGGEKSFDVAKLTSLMKNGEITRSENGIFSTKAEKPEPQSEKTGPIGGAVNGSTDKENTAKHTMLTNGKPPHSLPSVPTTRTSQHVDVIAQQKIQQAAADSQSHESEHVAATPSLKYHTPELPSAKPLDPASGITMAPRLATQSGSNGKLKKRASGMGGIDSTGETDGFPIARGIMDTSVVSTSPPGQVPDTRATTKRASISKGTVNNSPRGVFSGSGAVDTDVSSNTGSLASDKNTAEKKLAQVENIVTGTNAGGIGKLSSVKSPAVAGGQPAISHAQSISNEVGMTASTPVVDTVKTFKKEKKKTLQNGKILDKTNIPVGQIKKPKMAQYPSPIKPAQPPAPVIASPRLDGQQPILTPRASSNNNQKEVKGSGQSSESIPVEFDDTVLVLMAHDRL